MEYLCEFRHRRTLTPYFNILKYQYEFDAILIDKRGVPDQHLPAKLVIVNIEIDDRQWIIWAGKKILSEVEKEAFLGSLVVRYLKDNRYDFSNDNVPVITWEQLPAEIRNNPVNFERINFPPESFLIRTGTQIGFSS